MNFSKISLSLLDEKHNFYQILLFSIYNNIDRNIMIRIVFLLVIRIVSLLAIRIVSLLTIDIITI